MKADYFTRTDADAAYYADHLSERLPTRILDIHTHINLPEHVAAVPPERIADDWALQTGLHMTADDGQDYFQTMFPDREYGFVAFPFPIREALLDENNAYVADCVREGKIAAGLLCVRPTDDPDEIGRQLSEQPFAGIKPYPDMVSGHKGAEISIPAFLPEEQARVVEQLGKMVMLHLPRAGRLPDPANIRELRDLRQRFPRLQICIAHYGRCFTPIFWQQAVKQMGSDLEAFLYDTAAVLNPEVHRAVFASLPTSHVLYGSDQPIFLWHGRRRWTETSYQNLAREDFPWNKHVESPKAEADYTFYIYEQVRNILDVMGEQGYGMNEREAVFARNARLLIDSCSGGARDTSPTR